MRQKISTNVRLMILQFYRLTFMVLGWVSTPFAAMLAEYLFRSVARRPETEREAEALRSARAWTMEHEGKRVSVWQWGEGPIALLVHGWGGSAAQLLPLVDVLRKSGYSVVAFDAPAHGHSEGRQSSLPQFASALGAVAAQVGPVEALVTHSMGGAAASLAMAGGLRVQRAVFIAPPADAQEWLVKFTKQMGLTPKVAAVARRRMERRLGIRFDRLNAKVLSPWIAAPLLVIHDRGDAEVIWYDGAAVASAAVHGHLHTTTGLGHRRILRDPQVLQDTISFLRESEPASALSEPNEAFCHCCGETPIVEPEQGEGICDACRFERELFDKELRWQQAPVHGDI